MCKAFNFDRGDNFKECRKVGRTDDESARKNWSERPFLFLSCAGMLKYPPSFLPPRALGPVKEKSIWQV